MAITIVTSADVGAPSLTNAAGSMVALLDYLLVTKLGWTKPYTGTNKAAFKQPAGTNGMYFRVEDLTTVMASAKVCGFETMTDVDTGTGQFPTEAQVPGKGSMNKSSSATACYWYFISNGKFWYLVVFHNSPIGGPTGTPGTLYGFGDLAPIVSGDAYATMIMASANTGGTDTGTGGVSLGGQWFTSTPTYCPVNYIARSYTQIGASKQLIKFTDTHLGGATSNMNSGALQGYPDPATGSLRMGRVHIAEQGAIRGDLPGVWSHNHNITWTSAINVAFSQIVQDFTGSGETAGRTFRMFYFSSCGVIFETSDTWNT